MKLKKIKIINLVLSILFFISLWFFGSKIQEVKDNLIIVIIGFFAFLFLLSIILYKFTNVPPISSEIPEQKKPQTKLYQLQRRRAELQLKLAREKNNLNPDLLKVNRCERELAAINSELRPLERSV